MKFEHLWVHQFETSVRKATANDCAVEFQALGSCASLAGPSILREALRQSAWAPATHLKARLTLAPSQYVISTTGEKAGTAVLT